jgi:hypothetical protein
MSLVGVHTFFCQANEYCIYGRPDNANNIIFTVHSAQAGWAGFGIGTRMSDSAVFIRLILVVCWLAK